MKTHSFQMIHSEKNTLPLLKTKTGLPNQREKTYLNLFDKHKEKTVFANKDCDAIPKLKQEEKNK